MGLENISTAAAPLYTLTRRRETPGGRRVMRWEYQGRYHDGEESPWISELEALESFTPLQLDMFHALWNLYQAGGETEHLQPKRKRRGRQEALCMFPVGTKILRTFIKNDQEDTMTGSVYDFKEPYWRIRYPDGDWEELTKREMESYRQ